MHLSKVHTLFHKVLQFSKLEMTENVLVSLSIGENGAEIIARLKRDLLPTMLNGVMYWPVCDFITFRFVPVHLQVCSVLY